MVNFTSSDDCFHNSTMSLNGFNLKMTILVAFLLLAAGVVVGGLECDEPVHKHYCVLKGHVAKELPPGEPPLSIGFDMGVSVKIFFAFFTVVIK